MLKDILLYIVTGIVVLGSVFGATHLRKLATKAQQALRDRKLIQEGHKPARSEPAVSREDSRIA